MIERSTKKKRKYRYQDKNGNGLPSVTEILKIIPADYLVGWANYMGLKGVTYKTISEFYTEIGTAVHNAIEDYLLGREIRNIEGELDLIMQADNCFNNFLDFIKDVGSENITTLHCERTLIETDYAGTADWICNMNGKTVLVDFKTSKKISGDYFIQLSAYLNAIKDIDITHCAILRLDKKEAIYEYEEKTVEEIREKYLPVFLKLLDVYKSLVEIELL